MFGRKRSVSRTKAAPAWITKIHFHKAQPSPWSAHVYLDEDNAWYDWEVRKWKKYGASRIESKYFVTHEQAEAWLSGWGERFAAIVEELKEKETRTECIVG